MNVKRQRLLRHLGAYAVMFGGLLGVAHVAPATLDWQRMGGLAVGILVGLLYAAAE